jgi:hypothetical protein
MFSNVSVCVGRCVVGRCGVGRFWLADGKRTGYEGWDLFGMLWVGQGRRDKGQGTRDKGQGTRDKGQGTRDKGQGTSEK